MPVVLCKMHHAWGQDTCGATLSQIAQWNAGCQAHPLDTFGGRTSLCLLTRLSTIARRGGPESESQPIERYLLIYCPFQHATKSHFAHT